MKKEVETPNLMNQGNREIDAIIEGIKPRLNELSVQRNRKICAIVQKANGERLKEPDDLFNEGRDLGCDIGNTFIGTALNSLIEDLGYDLGGYTQHFTELEMSEANIEIIKDLPIYKGGIQSFADELNKIFDESDILKKLKAEYKNVRGVTFLEIQALYEEGLYKGYEDAWYSIFPLNGFPENTEECSETMESLGYKTGYKTPKGV